MGGSGFISGVTGKYWWPLPAGGISPEYQQDISVDLSHSDIEVLEETIWELNKH